MTQEMRQRLFEQWSRRQETIKKILAQMDESDNPGVGPKI
jgi:hypothetical protein